MSSCGVTILGSTGSIGVNALDVIRRYPKRFHVVGLATNANIALLLRQIKEFSPAYVAVKDANLAFQLKGGLPKNLKLFVGQEGIGAMVQQRNSGRIILGISGAAALGPFLRAIECGRTIALANKEALVMAGPLINKLAARHKAKIIPVDSEQSAIWQCLEGEDRLKLRNVYLTASGGPLRMISAKEFFRLTVDDVLRHPRWKMGVKITVDSATLMNKGLELLEAMNLFDLSVQKIKVVIHPEAIIHSMVEFIDGVIMAQLSTTDMRIPIQYALTYPERLPSSLRGVDFFALKSLNFEKPDMHKFPCLGLAYEAARALGTMPAVLNAANEVAVAEFLNRRIKFSAIPGIIERVMRRHRNTAKPALDDILSADTWAREEALNMSRTAS